MNIRSTRNSRIYTSSSETSRKQVKYWRLPEKYIQSLQRVCILLVILQVLSESLTRQFVNSILPTNTSQTTQKYSEISDGQML